MLPSPPQPPTDPSMGTPAPQPMAKIPLTAEALAQWRGDLDKARAIRKTVSVWWEENLKKYAPDQSGSPDNYGDILNTNRDFTLVERKKADLFDQRPDVTALPSPLMETAPDLLDTHTKIMTEKLGIDGVDVEALADQVLFDVLCTAGTGWTVMGYESVTVPTPTVNPMTGLQEMIPVPVFEDCYWVGLSPKQGLKPHDFRSSRWDKAPWLAYDFEMPLRVAKRKGWVPEDFKGSTPSDDTRFKKGSVNTAGDAVVNGTLVYYQSALYRDDRVHPQHYTLLVLIEGLDKPAEHKDSPLQTLDAQGRLTPDSLIGNPIHPCTIRTLTDSSDVPSDCTVWRPLVNELNKFREQGVQNRDSQLIVGFYDAGVTPPEVLEKLIRAPINGLVGLPSEMFAQERPIKPVERPPFPRENFAQNDYIDNDLARTSALDSNAQGVQGDSQTATEASIQREAVNRRLGKERSVVLKWYLKGYTKYSSIVMRYLSVEDAAKIVGPQAAQAWDAFRKQVPASLAFSAMPDSTQRTDLATDRKQALDQYSFFANDPYINRMELLKSLLPKLHYPTKVLNPQPPEKGPEPTKPGLSLKGEDLNPLMPQFPILVEVLGQCGIKISPQAIQQAQEAAQNQVLQQQVAAQASAQTGGGPQTAHGGKVAQQESLSKHHADLSGGMQGTGQEAPAGPGGMLQ